MNAIFPDVIDEYFVIYMDDFSIFRKSRKRLSRHFEAGLERLKNHELYVGKKKYLFLERETKFLGLIVGPDGICVGDNGKIL